LHKEAAKTIVSRIQDASKFFKTEEDVRLRCEGIFIDELNKMKVTYNPSYEAQVSSGFIDALFNQLCIEYKKPGELVRRFDFHVRDKSKYIHALAAKYRIAEEQIVCVLIDGFSIGYFRKNLQGVLVKDGPYAINEKSISHFISLAHATQAKALISENLLNDFGFNSPAMQQITVALWNALCSHKDPRTEMFFKEWHRLFGQISGISDGSSPILNEAIKIGLTFDTFDYSKYVFVLQTTYAIYIKHIALMILQAKQFGYYRLYQEHLEESLYDISMVVENGSIFYGLGISNFMEGDFFCWYVLEWNEEIEQAIQTVIKILGQYEPSTASLKPEVVKDLLKELYQGLLPKSVRHNLGEYYTPDWLAELTIKESGYKVGDKVLDPSCGSGTFLVLLINRIIEQMKENHSPNEIISHIQNSVYGFDLNPLAVITARTNYLIAIEPYWDAATTIELPVYLTDAIFSPKQDKEYYRYHIDTEDGRLELCIPGVILQNGLLVELLNKIENLVRLSTESGGNVITKTAAETTISNWLKNYIGQHDIEIILDLFSTLYSLEMKNWDGIWCRIIKNHFASALLKDFDVIVGNPPWLKWSALPPAYRETIKEFCVQYDLFSSDKFYGGIESDVSTMVLYSAAEKWLRFGGRLSMLITRSVFKTESSEGFRMFRLPNNEQMYFKVLGVHDFTKVRPFDGAVNKPTLLTLEKQNEATKYPLPWLEWHKVNGAKITNDDILEVVLQKTHVNELYACPINSIGSPWLTIPKSDVEGCRALTKGESEAKFYYARKGICTDSNGIFFGSIVGVQGENTIFENDPSLGRNKTIKRSTVSIENDLLYPIARGKEISYFKWSFGGTFGIVPQKSMHGFSEETMIQKYPKILQYFASHKHLLAKRSSLKRYLPNDPFYACWNIGEYTFSPYKVCWSEISSSFRTCIIANLDGKPIVPDHKIYFIPLDNEEEAKYLCAYLNATIVEELILGYVETTQIGTHITDYVRIPKYLAGHNGHKRLVHLAELAMAGKINIEEARQEASILVSQIINESF
jgi:hypothetical protein